MAALTPNFMNPITALQGLIEAGHKTDHNFMSFTGCCRQDNCLWGKKVY